MPETATIRRRKSGTRFAKAAIFADTGSFASPEASRSGGRTAGCLYNIRCETASAVDSAHIPYLYYSAPLYLREYAHKEIRRTEKDSAIQKKEAQNDLMQPRKTDEKKRKMHKNEKKVHFGACVSSLLTVLIYITIIMD